MYFNLSSYHFQLPYFKESYKLYIFYQNMLLNRACKCLTDFIWIITHKDVYNIFYVLNLKSLVVMRVYVEPAQFSENLSNMYDFSLMAGFL